MDVAGFSLSEGRADAPLGRILAAALGDRLSQPSLSDVMPDGLYWDAQFFNLERVSLFQEASLEEKRAILQMANRGLMEEAYFIEKAGMGYMAKMVLLAETLTERMLYSLFVTDEALHLSQIRPFFSQEPVTADDPFLHLLAEVVAHPDKALMLFVLQVVLEGWGLSHYRYLAQGCLDPQLANLWQNFLHAEAQHHATGVTLFAQATVAPATQAAMTEVLASFLQMVRIGPQRIVAAIGLVKGGLSRTQKLRVLEELDTQNHSGKRLKLLRSLMGAKGAEEIVEYLENKHLFQPLAAQQCVF